MVRKAAALEAGASERLEALVSEDVFEPHDIEKMLGRLEDLRARHRDLDLAIDQLDSEGGQDFKVMTLKREKLRLKDQIAWLSSKLTPDIIA